MPPNSPQSNTPQEIPRTPADETAIVMLGAIGENLVALSDGVEDLAGKVSTLNNRLDRNYIPAERQRKAFKRVIRLVWVLTGVSLLFTLLTAWAIFEQTARCRTIPLQDLTAFELDICRPVSD